MAVTELNEDTQVQICDLLENLMQIDRSFKNSDLVELTRDIIFFNSSGSVEKPWSAPGLVRSKVMCIS